MLSNLHLRFQISMRTPLLIIRLCPLKSAICNLRFPNTALVLEWQILAFEFWATAACLQSIPLDLIQNDFLLSFQHHHGFTAISGLFFINVTG